MKKDSIKLANEFEELVKALQDIVSNIEILNLKHKFPKTFMNAKTALQKVIE